MVLKRSRWLVLAAALVVATLTARLGVWQLDRADQKNRLQRAQQQQGLLPPLTQAELARSTAAVPQQEHRAVVLQGTWSAPHTVFLENRQMNGRPGFYALTPLLLDDGSAVLVQRGWLPRDMLDRVRIAAPPPPPGVVRVQGHIAAHPGRLFEFAGAASGAIRQNLDTDAFARETGLRLLPLTVVQDDPGDAGAGTSTGASTGTNTATSAGSKAGNGAAPRSASQALHDGLLRQWPMPAVDVHKHYGYAFQWFAISALIIGLYVWFQLIRPGRQARRQQPAAEPA